jgi:hypothetical protein
MTELTEQQRTARRNLLDELEYGIVRRLGETIADQMATAVLEGRSIPTSTTDLIRFAVELVHRVGDGGIGRFDPTDYSQEE